MDHLARQQSTQTRGLLVRVIRNDSDQQLHNGRLDGMLQKGVMSRHERAMIGSLVLVVLALLLVGFVSGTVLRHMVQAAPALLAGVAAGLRLPSARFTAMPLFLFWLLIMVLIWLYLLGVAKIITGSFSAAEIALTFVIGLGCVVGLGASARVAGAFRVPWWKAMGFVAIFATMQLAAMWLSFQPAIANR